MCGFVAVYGRAVRKVSDIHLRSAGEFIEHRGPDSSTLVTRENFKCIHNRLGIVGLSSKYNQPYVKNGNILAFNGEIYDFKGDGYESDTDFLIDSLSLDINNLSKHSGMYAGVFLESGKLTVFRDFYGKKPLYISIENDLLIIASEIRPILFLRKQIGLNNTISKYSLSSYLCGGSVHGFNTLVEEIKEFKNNTLVKFDEECSKVFEKEIYSDFCVDENSLDFREVFENSVRKRTVTDVPLSVTFSGGVDSLAVALQLKKIGVNCTLFTLENKNNAIEVENAKKAACLLQLPHEIRHFEDLSNEKLLDRLKKLDHPIVDSSFLNVCSIMEALADDFKVCISGDGGDELLGGYEQYRWLERQSLGIRVPAKFRSIINATGKQKLISYAFNFMNKNYAVNQFYSRLFNDNLETIFPKANSQSIFEDRSVFYGSFSEGIWNTESISESDLFTTMRELILTKVDRASMLYSVEVRSPLLDVELYKWRKNKILNGQFDLINRKEPLKKIIREELGESFLNLPKTGFGLDLRSLLDGLYKDDYVQESFQRLNEIGLRHNKVSVGNESGLKQKKEYLLLILAIWLSENMAFLNL